MLKINFKKFIFSQFILITSLSAFNVNLNITPGPMPLMKPLPVYGENNNVYNKNTKIYSPVLPQKMTPAQEKKSVIVKQNSKNTKVIKAGKVKIVSSDVIEKMGSNPYENVCRAFIEDNSNRAFDYGYKEGVKYTKLYIGKFLLKHKKALDILFPLKQLYLDKGILQPPLIGEKTNASFTYANGDVYRQYGVKYYIKEKAKFVTKGGYRKWEDFLLDYSPSYYKKPMKDVLTFKFRVTYSNSEKCNREIKRQVYESFRKGFVAGEKEVFLLMQIRLKKLVNFLNELYLYNNLYYRGIINPPLISEFVEPVYKTTHGKSLIINEKVLKIVKPAQFNMETKKWKVFLIRNDKVIVPHIEIRR